MIEIADAGTLVAVLALAAERAWSLWAKNGYRALRKADLDQAVMQLEAGMTQLRRDMKDHMAEDDRRFGHLHERVTRNAEKVSNHEGRLSSL